MAVRKFGAFAQRKFDRFSVIEPPQGFRQAGYVTLILMIELEQTPAHQEESDHKRIFVGDLSVVECRWHRRDTINYLAAVLACRAFAGRAAGSARGRDPNQGK